MRLQLEIRGSTQTVEAELIKNMLWIYHQGRTYVCEQANGGRKKRHTNSDIKSGHIIAPMPGKITKLSVSSGQSVKTGDAILVMEAMKMEYTLKSSIDGVVEKINTQVGDQVVLGKILVELKEG